MNNPYETPKSDVATDFNPDDPSVLNLASRWQRFFGGMIDALVVGGISITIAFQLGIYENAQADGTLPLNDHLLALALGLSIFMIVNGVLIYKNSQTFGKMIMGTRVVSLEGKQISGNHYIGMRMLPIWIVTQIPLVGQLIGLIDALLIFRQDKNCLHDDIAKTRVITIR